MKILFSLICNKTAVRILLLFLTASLLPMALLGYLSFHDISTRLSNQTNRQLQQVSRAAGQTIMDRLDNLHRELSNVAAQYLVFNSANKPVEQFKLDDEIENDFSAIVINSAENQYIALYNGIDEFPQFTQQQIDHLQNGNPLLVFSDYSNFQKKILLVKLLDSTDFKAGYLIAEINQKYLWNFGEIIHNPTFGCVSTENHKTLYCTSSKISHDYLSIALTKNNETSATFRWKEDNMPFVAFYWTIFLEGKYGTEPWLVVLSAPDLQDKTAIESIQSVYPKAILLTVFLAIILTIVQMRRNLIPLSRLQQATKQVGTGDFSSRVISGQNNEFKTLIDSFNSMAFRLDKQFKSLSTMAEVDHIILSTSNMDYVVDIVLKRFMDIVPCDFVMLTLPENNIIKYSESKDIKLSKNIFKSFLKFEDDDSNLLLAHPKHLIVTSVQHAPKFTKELIKKGAKTLVIYPITIGNILQTVITLGFKNTQNVPLDDLARGRELVDRIAVALSNADKEGKIYEQANFDSLTKLPNRTLVLDRLEQATQRARRDGTQIAALLVDLDLFKSFNDTLGHSAGDQLLKEVATRLKSVIGPTDTLGRLSGDEFLVLISDINYKSNSTTAITSTVEKIISAIKYPFNIYDHEVNVSASVGISLYPADSKSTEDLLRYAEIAMYHAKSKHKGTYQFYSKDINANSVAQLVIENNLRQAIHSDELELHFQPLQDLKTGKIVAAEALVRWHHPDLGDLAPNYFLPIADSSGLIVPMGEWTLRKACGQIRQWINRNIEPPRIAINLSMHQFREKNLVKRIKQILIEYDLDVKYLELEITEDTIMQDVEQTSTILRTLNEMGIGLVVDDFGAGYSSLNYLAKFPTHYLKIDRSFIKDVIQHPHVTRTVNAIIALAHSLRLQVIAKGIETQEQYDYLESMQCNLLQGNLIGAPLPPDEFIQQYLRHNSISDESRRSI